MSPFNIRCRWKSRRKSKSQTTAVPAETTIADASTPAAVDENDAAVAPATTTTPNSPESESVESTSAGTTSKEREIVVKISLQLYKVQENIYLLDFHSLEGHPFRFMSLCSKVSIILPLLLGAQIQSTLVSDPWPWLCCASPQIICNLQMGLSSRAKLEERKGPISRSAPQ